MKRFSGVLTAPPHASGIFQTSTAGWALGGRAPGQHPPELYVDQKVIAFRVPQDAVLPTPTITASGGYIYSNAASDHLTFEVIGSRLKPGCAEDKIVADSDSQIQALAAAK